MDNTNELEMFCLDSLMIEKRHTNKEIILEIFNTFGREKSYFCNYIKMINVPNQENGIDCGLWASIFIYNFCENIKVNLKLFKQLNK